MDYLQRAKKREARALFAYLARAGGRKPWGSVSADSSPLRNQDDRLVLAPMGMERPITRAFYRRISAPAGLDPQHQQTDPNAMPPPKFREAMRGEFQHLRNCLGCKKPWRI